MNFALLSLFLLGLLAFRAHAAPESRPVKVLYLKGGDDAYKAARAQQMPVTAVDSDDHFFAEHRQANDADDVEDYNYEDDAISNEAKASDNSARLFIRRFMRLKNNIFGNKKQRIIIQIFPNGTSSVTTLPITNNVVVPAANLPTPSSPSTPSAPFRVANDDDYANVDSVQDVVGTIDTQRKGAKKDQDIIVRIPAEYKHLFNSGQQVMLSTNNGVNKRRVTNKKRVNKNRKGVDKNNNHKMKNQYLQRTRFVTV